MTRFRMGAPVTAPQDAPGRGSKPAPSTPGEPVLKAEPDDRVPRCGREAPPFTAGEDVTMSDPSHRFADADDIEAAREQALERLEDMEHDDDHEAYSAGWIDACVMMDRILTDPEYFGLQEDSDE